MSTVIAVPSASIDAFIGNFGEDGYSPVLVNYGLLPHITNAVLPPGGENELSFGDYWRVGGTYRVTYTYSVPEPASWAMFIGGFGMIGGAMRRHRKVRLVFGQRLPASTMSPGRDDRSP